MNIFKSDLLNESIKDSIYSQFSSESMIELSFLIGRMKSDYLIITAFQARVITFNNIDDNMLALLSDTVETILSDQGELISRINNIINDPDSPIDKDDINNIRELITQYSDIVAMLKVQYGLI